MILEDWLKVFGYGAITFAYGYVLGRWVIPNKRKRRDDDSP